MVWLVLLVACPVYKCVYVCERACDSNGKDSMDKCSVGCMFDRMDVWLDG